MRKLAIILFILLVYYPASMYAQPATRAVVIGISDYQDEKIPDLKYAHRDIEAFVQYLKSDAGGNVPTEHIKTLVNEEATAAQIFRLFDWLIDESKEKDQVIIYFSGHGDVETKTIRQRGYLLAYDTPYNNYRAGAIGLDDINDIIATLSQHNKAKITLITDACHSGNLAGQSINGTQATATALTSQFANEVKIMSCQPNEVSLESDHWGGGRGLFSYHLIDGLVGLADKNNDYQINLRELGRYLEDKVSEAAAPESQIPMTLGNKNTPLAFVNDQQLASLIKAKKSQPNNTSLASKTPKSNLLANVSANAAAMFNNFEAALESKYFFPTDLTSTQQAGQSASELYDMLAQNQELSSLQNIMKGNFAAALQETTQQTIIAYLNTDSKELSNRYNFNENFYHSNALYVDKAAELLGQDHYLYDNLLAKKHYFNALVFRLKAEKSNAKVLLDSAFSQAQIALQYDNQAAFIYNEMGLTKMALNEPGESIQLLDSARTKAPTWALPVANLVTLYTRVGRYHEADSMSKVALDLKPDYYQIYNNLGLIYKRKGLTDQAKSMYWKTLSHNPFDTIACNNLGSIYLDAQQYDSTRYYLKKSLQLDSTYFWGNYNMGNYHSDLAQIDSSIFYYQKAIQKRPGELTPRVYLAYQYMYNHQFEEAKATLDALNKYAPNHFEYHFGVCCWNALQNNIPEGIRALEKAIKNGLTYDRIEHDSDIDTLRSSDQFKALIKEHFPE